MMKTFIPAAAALALMAGAAMTTTTPAQASDGIAGNYFAIGGCFKSRSAANSRARKLGAEVVRTDDYPNFRAGWWCACRGRSSVTRPITGAASSAAAAWATPM